MLQISASHKDSFVASSAFSSPIIGALLKISIISCQKTGFLFPSEVYIGERTFSLHKVFLKLSCHSISRRTETFEMIALFIYGSSTLIDPFNVAACVLGVVSNASSMVEELLMVSRCIESLAFMACMEILDPKGEEVMECEVVNDILNHDLWIKDLIALPFNFFKRIIVSLRRQGMKENTIPVGFYFALLSRTLDVGLQNDSCKGKVEDEIATLLPLARLQDFLVPKSDEVDSICSIRVASNGKYNIMLCIIQCRNQCQEPRCYKLWDQYISLLLLIPQWSPKIYLKNRSGYRKYLNCQKLSQNACIEAIQNENVRLVWYANYGDFSGSLSSSKSRRQIINDLPTKIPSRSDIEFSRRNASPSLRIQNLEQEILSLKRILQSKNTSKRQETTPTMEQSMKSYCMEGRSLSKRKNSLGQVTSCIGSMNFNWRRTYSKWILKIFRRVRSFGRQKSK
ncbi:hypothetical protein K2173_018292 [Erythroxylum novogranatense]|uniref:BTB/POZ domain-containing protein n=1 Tax=Erythroxylum novogranatense TaxID=1862640 RepID=A0AAV8UDY7_9ROSI|nr:hypothetical protein K2173_018292 [Erythroxylum novogranatense]